MWAKIIKRTKDLNYFSLCALNYVIHEFHNLSWITEINELFHDILIYWDSPVYFVFQNPSDNVQETFIIFNLENGCAA